MRIPYLDYDLERRLRWTEGDCRVKASPMDLADLVESCGHLDASTLERLRDCLNREIESRAATRER